MFSYFEEKDSRGLLNDFSTFDTDIPKFKDFEIV